MALWTDSLMAGWRAASTCLMMAALSRLPRAGWGAASLAGEGAICTAPSCLSRVSW